MLLGSDPQIVCQRHHVTMTISRRKAMLKQQRTLAAPFRAQGSRTRSPLYREESLRSRFLGTVSMKGIVRTSEPRSLVRPCAKSSPGRTTSCDHVVVMESWSPMSQRRRRRRAQRLHAATMWLCLLGLVVLSTSPVQCKKPSHHRRTTTDDDDKKKNPAAAAPVVKPTKERIKKHIPDVVKRKVPSIEKPRHRKERGTSNTPSSHLPKPVLEWPPPPSVETDFFQWCQQVLGIQTVLKVETFQYYDYFRVFVEQVDDECDDGLLCDDDAFVSPSVQDYPMISVRGLAATRDVALGEVVISIPFHAMISVSTTIDHDPVLSQLMGPEARRAYGWQDDSYFELPLLTMALLYHRRLGRVSPLYHYIQILKNSPVDSMPFLWDRDMLRREATEGVARIARGIKRDVREMYNTVVTSVLIKDHPHVFGAPKDGEEEWMYSYPMFQWAFAMVNSRHWHLPIQDLENESTAEREARLSQHSTPSVSAQVPPAEVPTEEWVREQADADNPEQQVAENETAAAAPTAQAEGSSGGGVGRHSFLAPVADLLNFGPPCTRGVYNTETKSFELIATCSFVAGQEVTFWYSDDCADVMIANYGFTHPMVPNCLSVQDWRKQCDLWRQRAEELETEIVSAYDEIDVIESELQRTKSILKSCDCDESMLQQQQQGNVLPSGRGAHASRKKPHATLRHDTGVRGSRNNGHQEGSSKERHAIRREKKSDLGL